MSRGSQVRRRCSSRASSRRSSSRSWSTCSPRATSRAGTGRATGAGRLSPATRRDAARARAAGGRLGHRRRRATRSSTSLRQLLASYRAAVLAHRRALDRSRTATPRSSSTCSGASASRRGAPRTDASRPTPSSSSRAATSTGFSRRRTSSSSRTTTCTSSRARSARSRRPSAASSAASSAKLCFTVGHGELSLEPERDEREGLGALRDLLEKDNYELRERRPHGAGRARALRRLRGRGDRRDACAVRAGGGQPPAHVAAAGREPARGGRARSTRSHRRGCPPAGLDEVLAPFGIALDDDLVHDLEPERLHPRHARRGVLRLRAPAPGDRRRSSPAARDAHPPRVAAFFTRSLPARVAARRGRRRGPARHERRRRSRSADIAGRRATWTDAPPRAPGDRGRPVRRRDGERAAAHRPERAARPARRRPRQPLLPRRGQLAAAAAPARRRVPRRQRALVARRAARRWSTCRTGPRSRRACAISEEARAEVERYVLLFMPLAALLLGAVGLGLAALVGEQAVRSARGRRRSRRRERRATP